MKPVVTNLSVSRQVVTPDDIRRFFEQQQSRKRRRADGQMFWFSDQFLILRSVSDPQISSDTAGFYLDCSTALEFYSAVGHV